VRRLRAGWLAAGIAGAPVLALLAVHRILAAPRWRGAPGPNFDGKRFRSIEPLDHGFSDFVRWMTHRESGFWRDFTDSPAGEKPPGDVGDGRLRVTFVNHSTVLVQMDAFNFLTDPIWSERVSPFSWVGPRRHRPPGIRLEDLPPIDAVLLSHNHYDHMDVPTLRALAARHRPRIFCGLGNAKFLSGRGVPDARDFDWWESVPLAPGVTLTAVPARHFSSRSPFDRDRALWCGWVVSGPSGSFYFAGDTGWGSHFRMIGERFPNLRLALLPIGAYRPRWFMSQAHIDPEEAIRAQEVLGARTAIGIHFGTFAQADDGEFEPLAALGSALARHREPKPEFLVLDNGQSVELTGAGKQNPTDPID
jgi:L-ascorbate metabolism protein UlaG (beta-lactamase superfamily)